MKMATMRNRVRAGVLLTLSMVVPLLLVMTNATPALSQATVTVRVSNLDEPSDGYIGLNFDQEYAQSFCTGSVAVTLDKLRMYARSNGSDAVPVVTIRSDRSGGPGSVLDTLTNPLIDGSEATAADFTSGGYELTAATTYWVVVNRPRGTGGFSFDVTSSPAEDSETDSDWAIGDQILYRTENRWSEFSTSNLRYVMRMAIYASRDFPSISSPAFPDSDCNGTIDSYEFSVNENAAANTVVGTVIARDLDGDSLTYSVGGTDAAAFNETFAFDASTGEITVKSGALIDYESDSSYSITVSATDGEDASGAAESEATTDATVSVRIRVANLDEPGTVTLSQATPRVGSTLLATLDDPNGWVLLSAVQWSRADTADGPFTVLSFKYISSPRRASYTPEAGDEGKFLKVTLFYIDRQCRVVNSFNDQCRKMAEKTSDNAVAAAQSDGGTSMQQASNTPATGVPGITGTALAGGTLSATTDSIEDEDGLTGAVFAYQWLVDGADIDGATSSSYTLVAADEGKPIEVRVTFTDDAGNEESLTSNAVLAARFNSAATGTPTISGTAQVGQILTASTSGISDSDGLANAIFTNQWTANDGTEDTHIQNATGSIYILAAADEGKTIKVRVSFTDDGGNQETRTSAVTVAVAAAPTPLTATIHDAPESHDGQAAFKSELRFSEELGTGFSYKTLRDHAFTVTRGEVVGARRLDGNSDTPNIRWEISVTPDSTADVTVELPVTTDCDAQGAICTEDGTMMLSSPLKFTVSGPPLTASFESVPTSHNGSDSFRIRIAFSEAPKSGFSYTTMRDHAFTVTGGSVTGARRLVSGKNLRWEIVVSPDSNGNVTITLPATTDCDAQGAICADGDRKLSNRLERTVSGPGQ